MKLNYMFLGLFCSEKDAQVFYMYSGKKEHCMVIT